MRKFYAISPDPSGGDIPIASLPTSVGPITAAAPSMVAPLPINKSALPAPNPRLIPTPNYADPAARNQYLQSWQKLYGPLEGRGDTVLKVNETPRAASDTAKNLSIKSAKQYGIDPALLYSSAMEEGMSGLFKNQSGDKDTKGRSPGQPGYQDYFGDKEFPINGGQSFGFQTFAERFPDLVKKGLLPKEFSSNFRSKDATIAPNNVQGANDFKSTDAALQAKAAMLKYHYDDIDSYAKQRGIKLSPKARDFFALAEYNGGEGTGHQMLNDYNNNGQLEGDKFLQARPTSGRGLTADSYRAVYDHIRRRISMADALHEQELF